MKKILLFCGLMLTNPTHCSVDVAKTLRYYGKMLSAMEDDYVVVATKLLTFTEPIDNAHNASIIEHGDSYLMVFRYETKNQLCPLCGIIQNEIRMVELNKQFEQQSPIKKITLAPSFDPEDPRLHRVNGELYVTYNDEPSAHIHPKNHTSFLKRRLFFGKLDVVTASLSNIKQVPRGELNLTVIEKNWTPFEHNGNLHYIYKTFPYKIINVTEVSKRMYGQLCKTTNQPVYTAWENDVWGEIRGGTPARLVDDVYITFFHSWRPCPDGKNFYYVMGAYTFEAHPPFNILAVTPKPILFKEAYSAPHRNEQIHTVYPSGFAIERHKEKTILHVSCGENDTATRIVSIDKDALLKSMIPLKPNNEGNKNEP